MKAMFEDYFGDSLTAQKNYRSADSAYAILKKNMLQTASGMPVPASTAH